MPIASTDICFFSSNFHEIYSILEIFVLRSAGKRRHTAERKASKWEKKERKSNGINPMDLGPRSAEKNGKRKKQMQREKKIFFKRPVQATGSLSPIAWTDVRVLSPPE